MRKIKVCKWKGQDASGQELQENTILLLEMMLRGQDPKQLPRGLDKFRIYSGLIKAFDKAQKTGYIILDEAQYKFLADLVEKEVPAVWATNPKIAEAVEIFMDAKLITVQGEKSGHNSKSN